ncbi:MAG: hybrid-cluster NAD(P)-dependent oxidoreductase [Stappia sp.]|uniref:hybrid-cluster NAD(P)-dependent oxidoreductase n=1 Tax=Stappia sp. TaxID=1870903 RepID=UPI000C5662B9|nr:hybrid-cluster NAD(P)-dependent oxidoreductase [Stappia sp.]MAA97261.1 hybrid-cluster NAD(P)-dependent oxidoreductase [Stappia sp.]MBM19055.1 hybrid-cluster NAD(P)-dependent oxidoreductase [Stappia sp.]
MSRSRSLSFWTDVEPLECVSRLPEAPNVVTFSFRSPSGALFNHEPGQFITLELPVPGGPLHRTYTISSSPSRPVSLTVTVKAQPDSIGTRWMIDNLEKGMRLKAIGPAGRFSITEHPSEKYLFISAGSGITPMVAMTTWLYDSGEEPDVVFINCARRPSEIILRERVEMMASRIEGIDVKWVVEEADRFRPWSGYRGTFNQIMLGLMAQDYLEREVFCCGPEPFMQAVREALVALGYDMSRYHQESFSGALERAEAVPDDVVPDEQNRAEVVFSVSGVTARCSEADTVLAAARAEGLVIPSGCTMGICGTCKVLKTDGEVHMVHNGGITDEDIEEGYILACCSRPLGRVTVEA